jgi:hypothetical protein
MTSRLGDTLTWVSALLDTATAGDLATWVPCRPIRLRRWGYIWGVVASDPENFGLELDKRILTGSDTGRTAAIATIAGVAGETVGLGAYTRIGAAAGGDIDIDADEELVIQLPASGDTADGDAYVFIEYEALPFVNATYIGANLTNRDA